MTEVDRWPEADLERVPQCPVCNDARRSVLADDLADKAFGVAPGRWTLYRCAGCTGAWLDPRPTASSIGRAYESYHTHESATPRDPQTLGRRERARLALDNGYCNWKYGSSYRPASPLGVARTLASPAIRRRLDLRFRFLPLSKGARVLDLGFGAGGFLAAATAAGWRAEGVDIDPVVVANAKARGFSVRQGGLELYADERQIFDAITLSHVIEHVHEPARILADIHRLLRPGGRLFIDTPNLDAPGRVRFGPDWRGLEPPRHLVLFSRASMERALTDASFAVERWVPRPEVSDWMYRTSAAIRRGSALPRAELLRARAQAIEARLSSESEFLTLVAVAR